jgi:Carboxypeptidase regulatory-like domain
MLRRLVPLFVALVFLAGARVAVGQSTFGTVLGTVKDASGAVVPGARVVLTNTDENSSRSTVTDVHGDYEIVDVKPGHYAVTVTKPSFETVRISGLLLTARQTLRADTTLPLGKITQATTVRGELMGVIATDTPTISSSFDHAQISELPLNYRASPTGNSPYYLLTVLPGVQSDNSGNLNIQGALQSQSAFTVDGISTIDYTGNGPLRNAFPSAESLEEMKVQAVGAPAEFEDPSDVTTISKSGTNDLHGGIFEYDQNAAFNSIPFGASSKPSLVANDFGGYMGGPVVLPHLYNGRDKTFFFADFEGYRSPRTNVVQNTVPTQAMRGGDLSNFCTTGFTNGICTTKSEQIYNLNGQPFLNNQIPASMINPVSQKILTLYPEPNNKSTFTNNNFNTNRPANLNSNTFDVRIDQNVGSRLALFGRFTYKNAPQLSPNELTVPSSTTFEHDRLLVLSATYTIKPTMLNEFRFGLTDESSGNTNPFDGKSFANGLGLQNISDLWFNGITEVDFSGQTTSLNVDRLNGTGLSRNIEFIDNLTWVKGSHTFKFGFDTYGVHANTTLGFIGADNYGTFEFNGLFTGNDFADFLLGVPAGSALDDVREDNHGLSHHLALYAQDSFKVMPRLTLDYGLRWEWDPGYTDASGQIGNFNDHVPRSGQVVYPDGFASLLSPPYLQSMDACPTPGIAATTNDPRSLNGAPCTPVLGASQAGLPQGLRTTSKTFLPRFGFAYSPFHNDNTVVRGSIGSYQAVTLGSIYYSLTGTLQAYTQQFFNSLTPTGPAFTWPATKTGGSGYGAPSYGTDYFGTANQVNWKEPYSVQWALSVEHNMGFGTGLRVSYTGMKTTQLVWAPNWNQSLPSTTPYIDQPLSSRPFPNWGVVNSRDVGATANYNALQIEATHRFSHGLTFDSTYTWARNLADNQGIDSNASYCGEGGCNRSGQLYARYLEYGNTFGPRTNYWTTNLIYALPVGHGQHFLSTANPVANGVLGGWQLSNVFTVESGPWLSPYFSSGDPSGSGIGLGAGGGRSSAPDIVGPAYPANENSGQWFQSSGFACPGGDCLAGTSAAHPPIGRYGDAAVGSLEGPGGVIWDFGLFKSFRLTERADLKFQVSFVNVLNHTNLGVPDMKTTDLNNPSQGQCGFGCITAAQGLYQFSGGREGQIGARIDF